VAGEADIDVLILLARALGSFTQPLLQSQL
jgi:hypothetical protein